MNYGQLKELQDKRGTSIEALRALDTDIGDSEPTAEQRSQLDTINTELDGVDTQMERLIREGNIESRSAFFAELIANGIDAHDGNGDGGEERELTPAETEARSLMQPQAAEGATNHLDLRGTPEDIALVQRRSILAGTATQGAELVPTTLYGMLYTALLEESTSMFSLGRDIVTQAGEQMSFPKNTSRSTAALIGEGQAIGASEPGFATVTLNAYKYGLSIQVSPEFERDNAVSGTLPWIVTQAADGIRRGAGGHMISGDGVDKPNGVLNGANEFVTSGAGTPSGDDLIEAMHSIVSGYRSSAVWLFNDATIAGLRTLKDGDNQYLWQPGMTMGTADTLFGRPVHTDENVPVVGAGAKCGVFGDLKRGYLVRSVGTIRAERSTEYAFLNDLNTWKFIGNFDGEIIDDSAYTVIKNA